MHLKKPNARVSLILKRSGGFTLIEAMIALTILAVGILAVGAMQLSGIRGNGFSADLSEATAVTQQEIETLFAASEDSAHYDALASGNDTVTGARGTTFTRTWTVTKPTPDYATITVTTTWNDVGWRAPRTVTLTTVRTRS